jgi:hypothetical protein
MKKFIYLIIALVIFVSLNANTTKEVTTYLSFADETHPLKADLTYDAWLTERPSEIIAESMEGGSDYEQASGNHLVLKVYVNDVWVGEGTLILNNSNPQQMQNITLNDTDEPLAVTLASFAAVYTAEGPKLQWITISETNNSGWNIYRAISDDYATSIMINAELISGAGTTTQETSYEFFDEMETFADSTYWYWLESVENSGSTEVYEPIAILIPSDGYEPSPDIPIAIGLHGNYPNPFNPATTIRFALDEEGPYRINIYNIKGQKVMSSSGEITSQNAGKVINFVWEGTDNNGRQAASGLYFYTLESVSQKFSNKMLLIK